MQFIFYVWQASIKGFLIFTRLFAVFQSLDFWQIAWKPMEVNLTPKTIDVSKIHTAFPKHICVETLHAHSWPLMRKSQNSRKHKWLKQRFKRLKNRMLVDWTLNKHSWWIIKRDLLNTLSKCKQIASSSPSRVKEQPAEEIHQTNCFLMLLLGLTVVSSHARCLTCATHSENTHAYRFWRFKPLRSVV